MNQTIIDMSLLGASLVCAFIVSRCLKRKAGLFFSTLLLFSPLLVFLNMWAHTIAVTAVNLKRYSSGTFEYSFTLYSHYLFGIVFILLSGLSIQCSSKYLAGNKSQIRNIHLLNLATTLLFLPVGFINPIGFLPVVTSLFSSLVLTLHNPFKVLSIRYSGPEKTVQEHETRYVIN